MKKRAIGCCMVVALTVVAGVRGSSDGASSSRTVYSTWQDTMEVDKCASAWLIARFVDKRAEFKFVPQGTLDLEGIPFDVPTARLRSGRNRSTFEAVLAHYKLADPALVAIAGIVREIELSVWSDKQSDLAASLPKLIEGVRISAKDDHDQLRRGFVIMDALYAYTGKQVGG